MKNIREYRQSHQSADVVNTYKVMYQGFDSSFSIVDRFSYARWLIEKTELNNYFTQSPVDFNDLSCLDFACGTGRLTQFMQPIFSTITGIDISGKMIDVAKEKNIDAEFKVVDITRQDPDENNTYDVVIAFRFFLRAEDSLRRDVMLALRKRINKNGIFIFNVHDNPQSLNWPLFIYAKLFKRESPVHSNFDLGVRRSFEYNEVKTMLEDCGFEIEKKVNIGFVPNYLYGLPILYRLFYKVDMFVYKYSLFKNLSIESIYYCRAK